jgi:hypothetical protein
MLAAFGPTRRNGQVTSRFFCLPFESLTGCSTFKAVQSASQQVHPDHQQVHPDQRPPSASLLPAWFACATHQPPASEQLADQVKEQDAAQKKAPPVLAAKYSDCNRAAAKSVAFQQGDPESLALAAIGMCARFEPELEKVVKNAYGDVIDPSDANRVIVDAEQAMLERNAAEIAAYRAARASAPPRPKPPQTYDD